MGYFTVLCAVGVFFTAMIWLKSAEGFTCGMSSEWPCMDECYQTCNRKIKEGANVNDKTTKENMATERMLCIGKCYGEAYIAYRDQSVGVTQPAVRRPKYADFSDCVAPCGFPIPAYCLRGYASMFFYCDCHACCMNKLDPEIRHLCITGCREWFHKQWSPLPLQGCRAHGDVRDSATSWCTPLCTWRIWKDLNGTVKLDANGRLPSSLEMNHTKCVANCEENLASGGHVDFDNAKSHMCFGPSAYRCFTTAHITGYAIPKDKLLTQFRYAKSRKEHTILSTPVKNPSASGITFVGNDTQNFSQTLNIYRQSKIEELYRMGQLTVTTVKTTTIPSGLGPTENHVYESVYASLSWIYEDMTRSTKIERQQTLKELRMEQTVPACHEIATARNATYETIDELKIEYEMTVSFTGNYYGLGDMTQEEIETAAVATGQFRVEGGKIKGTAKLTGNFATFMLRDTSGGCKPITGCSHKHTGTCQFGPVVNEVGKS